MFSLLRIVQKASEVAMAIKITLDSFLAVLKRSNLLNEEQVTTALEKFRTAVPDTAADAKPFAEFLVRNKILTVWQAEKVLQGKHKGFFLGRYRLLSLLGKGGMSSVYLAEHTVMKRHCALKVLPAKRVNDASYLGRFHREAQAVAALDHPNIVRAYDVDMTADAGIDIHFLSMEFVQGKSLLELVQEKGLIPVKDAVEFIRQSALGLDHAHKAGLVHRDIKPGNLLITSGGVIKILDLGLARFFNDEQASLTVEHDEKVLGTADYISPEQAIDSHKVDHRTDIYSLGCTLYFLLTGHPPFNTGSLAQRLIAHQTRPAPPVSTERPDVPASLIAIMDRMMAKKVEDRYQSAQDVANAMSDWIKQPAEVSAPAPVAAPSSPAPTATPLKQATLSNSTASKTSPANKPRSGTGSSVVGAKASPPVPPVAVETAADPFGFLNEVSVEAVAPEPQSPSDSGAGRSSSKKLAQAAKETSNLTQSATEVVQPDLTPDDSSTWDDAFDPSLLNLNSDESAGPLDLEFSNADIGTPPEVPAPPKSKTKTIDQVKPPGPAISRPQLRMAIILAAIPILAAAIWFGRDVFQSNTPAVAPAGPTPTEPSPPAPATPKKLATPDLAVLEVGPEGHFLTVGDAVEYVRQNFQPLTETDIRTIQLKGGITYHESVSILSGSATHFPRNVTIRTEGTPPALIQGDGKQPALTLRDVDTLTIEGISLDGNGASVAVKATGDSPSVKLSGIKVSNFTSVGLLLENLNGAPGQEFVVEGLRMTVNAPEAVGIRCDAASANIRSVQIRNSRIVGPLKSGLEVSGFFWKTVVADCVISACQSGIRFDGGLIDDMTLVNNTYFKNGQAIVFAKPPVAESKDLRLQQLLFSGSQAGDVVVESGDVSGLADKLFGGADGRRLNRTDRNDPVANELDVFGGDGQRAAMFSFASADPTNPNYLKAGPDFNVSNPVPGAKSYIGAVAP